MLEKYALAFAFTTSNALRVSAALSIWAARNPEQSILPTAEAHADGIAALKHAFNCCKMLPFGMLDREIVRLQNEHRGPTDPRVFARDLDKMQLRFQDELKRFNFFFVSEEWARFYNQERPFGDLVWQKFEEARADLTAAGNCLALGQSTACVFHLMRAMEAIIRSIGARIGVAFDDSKPKTWRQITDEMDSKIKKLPGETPAQRREKEVLTVARVNLHHVGGVWRNKAMHPAADAYTQPQALDIWEATRVSMQSLAEI